MNAVSILGVVAVLFTLFLSVICFCAERGVHPLRRAMRQFRRIPIFGKLLIAIIVGGWIAFGGSKNAPTNSPPLGMMGPPMTMVGQSPNVVITEAETNLGYRVESIVEGCGIVPHVNATTNDLWRLRGGMADARRMENGKWKAANSSGDDSEPHWYFPYRDTFTVGLTVFANGEFRPNVKTTYFPKPFDAVLSLVPQGKWGQIANGGPSLFTHELTPSNSLMLSWQNALYNRNANCPTNFQAELFADGRFEYRYPDHMVQYAPVFSFDWDGDGLENSVDPNPFVAGPDAHGTNVEWYNNVCSNVYSATEVDGEIVLSPRSFGVNTNAYYFVDVVADRGPTPIYFMADGESRLGNPVIVARACETNHVPLLIGAEYRISSSVPVSVFTPTNVQMESSYDFAAGSADSIFRLPTTRLKWPVDFHCVTSGENGKTLTPFVDEGDRLLGDFEWTRGCCMMFDGSNVTYQCHSCACGGCSVTLTYLYEGYMLHCLVPDCGCSGHGEDAPMAPYVETESGAKIAVGFDKRYLLLGDPDENTVNAAPRSTRTVLRLRVEGGIHGGMVTVRPRNFEKLSPIDGALPTEGTQLILPYSVCEMVVTNEGNSASGRMRDVGLTVSFRENGTNVELRRIAELTICRFTVEGIKLNHDPDWHRYDAINIRGDGTKNGNFNLTDGEWCAHGMTNYPSCYVAGVHPYVKVRFRAEPGDLKEAKISADADTSGFVLGDLQTNRVEFTSGASQWTDYHSVETNAIPAMVRKYVSKWHWNVHGVEEDTTEKFLIGHSGEHVVYTVLDHPTLPWVRQKDHSQCAWTNALEIACQWADGATSTNEVMLTVTSNLFYNMGMKYDVESGDARYYRGGCFDLMSYLRRNDEIVNCYDQAYGVVVFANLLGVSSRPVQTRLFGYLNSTILVGRGVCNNPCYEIMHQLPRYVVENGTPVMSYYLPIKQRVCGCDDINRSYFDNHVYVRSGDLIFDACVGPVLGTMTHEQYLNSMIDHSTTNESVNGYFSTWHGGRSTDRTIAIRLMKEER